SQVGELGTVDVVVGGTAVDPTPEAAAAVVEASPRVEGQGQYNFAVELKRDTPGAYPIVLVSYTIACTRYSDPAQADTVKAFVEYMASAEGQAAAQQNAGNAPISDSQRRAFQPAIDAIAAAG